MMSVVDMVRRPREEIGVDARAQEFEGISEVGRRVVGGGRRRNSRRWREGGRHCGKGCMNVSGNVNLIMSKVCSRFREVESWRWLEGNLPNRGASKMRSPRGNSVHTIFEGLSRCA